MKCLALPSPTQLLTWAKKQKRGSHSGEAAVSSCKAMACSVHLPTNSGDPCEIRSDYRRCGRGRKAGNTSVSGNHGTTLLFVEGQVEGCFKPCLALYLQ